VARAFSGGRISEELLESLSDEDAIERLTEIKGIGRWTAEIALLRGLGRPDVFPGGDLGVVKYPGGRARGASRPRHRGEDAPLRATLASVSGDSPSSMPTRDREEATRQTTDDTD
jgi:hypothetical protein